MYTIQLFAFAQSVFVSVSSGHSNFSTTPMYGETAFMEYGTLVIGYFKGTFSRDTSSTPNHNVFALLDYGVIIPGNSRAVPEPTSLGLLATCTGGIAALRRRRAAR